MPYLVILGHFFKTLREGDISEKLLIVMETTQDLGKVEELVEKQEFIFLLFL